MKKVLIVDDDEGNIIFLSTVLNENGYNTVSASQGIEGMEMAKAEKPDLIILDVMMPKRSGFVLFKQLRKEEDLKSIPVIMLTAVAASIVEAEQSRNDDILMEVKDSFLPKLSQKVREFRFEGKVKPEVFLDKPIDPEELLKHVSELIGPGDKS